MAHPAKSKPSARIAGVPSTKRALDALSAMVSTREIFQSRIRLSTISMAGSTKATARNISATWGSSTSRSLPSSATSASAFGCSKPSGGRVAPSPTIMSDSKAP